MANFHFIHNKDFIKQLVSLFTIFFYFDNVVLLIIDLYYYFEFFYVNNE